MTINNLVPAGEPGKANPALDHKDYVPNPDGQAFGYTGYTKVLACVGVTKVCLGLITMMMMMMMEMMFHVNM